MTETLSGFATRSTRMLSLSEVISTGSTFISELETDSVQFPPVRYIRKFPALSISSLHSRPSESVAITSVPTAPIIALLHAMPEPFRGESLNQTEPSNILVDTR